MEMFSLTLCAHTGSRERWHCGGATSASKLPQGNHKKNLLVFVKTRIDQSKFEMRSFFCVPVWFTRPTLNWRKINGSHNPNSPWLLPLRCQRSPSAAHRYTRCEARTHTWHTDTISTLTSEIGVSMMRLSPYFFHKPLLTWHTHTHRRTSEAHRFSLVFSVWAQHPDFHL